MDVYDVIKLIIQQEAPAVIEDWYLDYGPGDDDNITLTKKREFLRQVCTMPQHPLSQRIIRSILDDSRL